MKGLQALVEKDTERLDIADLHLLLASEIDQVKDRTLAEIVTLYHLPDGEYELNKVHKMFVGYIGDRFLERRAKSRVSHSVIAKGCPINFKKHENRKSNMTYVTRDRKKARYPASSFRASVPYFGPLMERGVSHFLAVLEFRKKQLQAEAARRVVVQEEAESDMIQNWTVDVTEVIELETVRSVYFEPQGQEELAIPTTGTDDISEVIESEPRDWLGDEQPWMELEDQEEADTRVPMTIDDIEVLALEFNDSQEEEQEAADIDDTTEIIEADSRDSYEAEQSCLKSLDLATFDPYAACSVVAEVIESEIDEPLCVDLWDEGEAETLADKAVVEIEVPELESKESQEAEQPCVELEDQEDSDRQAASTVDETVAAEPESIDRCEEACQTKRTIPVTFLATAAIMVIGFLTLAWWQLQAPIAKPVSELTSNQVEKGPVFERGLSDSRSLVGVDGGMGRHSDFSKPEASRPKNRKVEFPTKRFNFALQLLDQGQFSAGIAELEDIGLETGSKRVHCKLAWAYLRNRDFYKAEKIGKNLVYLNHQFYYKAFGEQILGAVENRRGNFESAESHLTRALELLNHEKSKGSESYKNFVKNNIFSVLIELGLTHAFAGEIDSAKLALDKAQAMISYAGHNLTQFFSVHSVISLVDGNLELAYTLAGEALNVAESPKQLLEAKVQFAFVTGIYKGHVPLGYLLEEIESLSDPDDGWVGLLKMFKKYCAEGMPLDEEPLKAHYQHEPSIEAYFKYLKKSSCGI